MKQRILLLTQWFDPEPTFKGLVFARELIQQGFDVEVVTGFPNYPGGKVYPSYKIKWLQREVIYGVQITRLPLYPNHDQSAMKRILNYVSFAASSLFYGLFMAKRADVIYAYHPPLTVGITASLLRLIRRTPVVYDIQDMWPDTLRATGMLRGNRLIAIVSCVCNWVYKHVDCIVVLSPGFKKVLLDRGVPEGKVNIIYNWCDECALSSSARGLPEHLRSNKFTILFAGNMGNAQGLETIIDAAQLLKEKGAGIQFVMLGSGIAVDNLKEMVASKQLDNVVFYPRVQIHEVKPYFDAADALLVHLREDPLFKITIPSKTQAYMATAMPILMAVDGDAADLVVDSRSGVVAKSGNAESIAEAALKLSECSLADLQAMGARGRLYYLRKMSLEVGVAEFARLFKKLANKTVRE